MFFEDSINYIIYIRRLGKLKIRSDIKIHISIQRRNDCPQHYVLLLHVLQAFYCASLQSVALYSGHSN